MLCLYLKILGEFFNHFKLKLFMLWELYFLNIECEGYVFGLTCVLNDVFPVLATLSDNSWTSRRARHVCALFRAF